jgi:hypothetical protein
MKPDAIKGWWSKCGKGAGKVNVLTWGDLLSLKREWLNIKEGQVL